MTDYVRICPRCGQQSPEYENICINCRHFIGMEESVPVPTVEEKTGITSSTPAINSETSTEVVVGSLTQRFVPINPALFLEITKESRLPVYSGWRLGQPHSGSDAEVQLPAQISGVEFIHRYHCRFDYEQDRWYVTALDQRSFARDFTNPTQVNGQFLPPGGQFALNDGDELRLSGVTLWVRIATS